MDDGLDITFVDSEGNPRNMDQERLARLLWGENSDVSEEEALLIADSVLNRRDSSKWPDSIADVLFQTKQYHPFSGEGDNFERTMGFNEKHPQWERYMALAAKGLDPDRQRSNATHYFTGRRPIWAEKLDTVRVGDHEFGTTLADTLAGVFMKRGKK